MNFRIVTVLLFYPGLVLAGNNGMPPTFDVNVTNDTTSPVPVSIQNQPTNLGVNVTNDTTSPVPVSIQNNPTAAVIPFDRLIVDKSSGSGAGGNSSRPLPDHGRINVVSASIDPGGEVISCFGTVFISITRGGETATKDLISISSTGDTVSSTLALPMPIEFEFDSTIGDSGTVESRFDCFDPATERAAFSHTVYIEQLD